MSDGPIIDTRGDLPKSLQPWFTRIPAAIAKAEAMFKDAPHEYEAIEQRWPENKGDSWNSWKRATFTATEVALAKALWDYNVLLHHGTPPKNIAMIAPALIEFAQKVEEIT